MEMIRTISHRLRRAVQVSGYEAEGLIEDARLLAGGRSRQTTFRQSRMFGLPIVVKADESVGHAIYFGRDFEPQESRFLFENVRESDLCVDIGANIGFYTLGLARKAIRGSVHSFEPVPLNYHLLAVNVIGNRLTNVVLNQCAVGNTDGQTHCCIAEDGAFSSLVDTGRRAIVETATIALTRLDSYCAERNLARIDILKVDVEGGELDVLRGAASLLADPQRRPRLVMLELFEPMLRQFDCGVLEVQNLMRTYGYEPFVMIKRELVPFCEAHHNRYYNVLFLDSKHPQPLPC
jgi:FkbM family methyltransferase